jgi:hypothetical protein
MSYRHALTGMVVALAVATTAGVAGAAGEPQPFGVPYKGGTVQAVLDPGLGELAEAPPGYPTTPQPSGITLKCTSPKACVVTALMLTEGRTSPEEPFALTTTEQIPSSSDDICPVDTTLVSKLTVAGKKKFGSKRYPATVSGTIVFSWPIGVADGDVPCGGETWTYTFDKVPPASR